MKKHLKQIAFDIFSFGVENSIQLELEWIPGTLNDKADYIFKILDFDALGLSPKLFAIISNRWGSLPWFESEHYANVEKYYTRFWCEKLMLL